MPIMAAVGISAGAGILGASIGANAQTKAAQLAQQTQREALQAGMSNAQNYFGQAQQTLSPFISGGQQAYDTLAGLTGANVGGNPLTAPLTKPFTPADLEQTPGYQFTLNQGLKAVQNKFASQGQGGASGPLGKGLADYATGLAQNTYNQQFQNYLTQNQQIASILGGLVTPGLGAANALSGIAGQLGTAGLGANVQTGAGIGQAQIGAGNAVAGAATGAANSLVGGVNTALQYSLLAPYLQQMAAANAARLGTGATPGAPSVAPQSYVPTAISTNPGTSMGPGAGGGMGGPQAPASDAQWLFPSFGNSMGNSLLSAGSGLGVPGGLNLYSPGNLYSGMNWPNWFPGIAGG